jgi:RNA polymerase sigma factor (sigma-70 family)
MAEPEAVLLARYARSGDPDAFRSLVEVHQHMVYAVCHRILGNQADAEDAAQNCLFKLATKASKLRAPISGWLHRVAVTASIDLLRQRRARRQREAKAAGEAARARPKELSWERVKPRVDEAIAALPERLRIPVVLYYLEHLRQEEIARELGISQPAVSGRLKRGVDELRKRLERSGLFCGAAALGTVLYANSVEAAPAGLLAAVGKIALAGAGGLYVSAGAGAGAVAVKVCALTAGALVVLGAIGALLFAALKALQTEPHEPRVVVAEGPAAAAEPRAPETPPAAGVQEPLPESSRPSLEVILNPDGAGTDMFLDLDTGRLATIPGDIAELDRMVSWMRAEGIDVLYSRAIEPRRLVAADLAVRATSASAWDTTTAETFRNAPPRAPRRAFPVFMGADHSRTGAFVFVTREGSPGVLQILGFDEPKHGSARIRYRLLAADDPG